MIITNVAEAIYSDLLTSDSVMQMIFSVTGHQMHEENHKLPLEILSRILSGDSNNPGDRPLNPENGLGYKEDIWRYTIHEAFSNSPKWGELLAKCDCPEKNVMAGVAMCHIVRSILNKLPKTKMPEPLSSLRRKIKIAKQLGGNTAKLQQDIEACYRAYNDIEATLVNQTDNIVELALNNALMALEPAISGSLTGDMPGMNQKAIAQKIELNIVYSQGRARQILKLLGRMQQMVSKAAANQPRDLKKQTWEYGNNIPMLIVDEFLKDDDIFLLDFAEEKLIQKATQKAPAGNGPIVVCLDESSSMADLLSKGVSKDAWAKAFLLLVAKMAKKEKRDVIVVGFGGRVSYTKDLNKISNADLDEILNQGASEPCTNWKPALNEAIKIIEKHKSFQKADILFVTDGEDHSIKHDKKFLEELQENKQKFNFKIQGILAGRGEFLDTLSLVADSVAQVQDLEDTAKLVPHH